MTEIWRDIPGYKNVYMVSDIGRVRSFAKNPKEGRILKSGKGSHGYFTVSLGRGNSRTVHSLVMEAFVGPKPPKHDVLHLDGTRTNNCFSNLKYGTRRENNLQIVFDGKRMFTPEDIRAVRLSNQGLTFLAKKHGCCISQISAIKNRVQYDHVGD